MVVSSTARKQTFAGAQTTLTFTFRALADHPEYIKVKRVIVATGVESDLIYNTDFTVSVDADGVGGTVTLTPTFSTASNLVVYRETDLVQESDYDDYNQFPAATLEENLDALTMIVQEQSEDISRVITFPISSNPSSSTIVFPTPEANKLIGWNTAATALENKTAVSLGTATLSSVAEAQAATNNTNYMTPYLVKVEVENSGSVLIPAANVSFTGITTAIITNATITNLTVGTINITTLKVGTTNQGDIIYDNGTSFTRLTPSTSGLFLKTQGAAANPIWAAVNSSGSTVLLYTSSTTFNAPAGITKVYVSMIGGGGGGGGTATGGAGGGGGGEGIIMFPYTVVPANNYTVTVGAAGAAGNNTNGGSGGTTTFDTISVVGGGGGLKAQSGGTGGTLNITNGSSNSNDTGGAGGTFYSFAGGNGGTALNVADHGGGGGGGSLFGQGGAGGNTSSNGTAGTGFGSGGGGGGHTGTTSSGGTGTVGAVILIY